MTEKAKKEKKPEAEEAKTSETEVVKEAAAPEKTAEAPKKADERAGGRYVKAFDAESWIPKTDLGKKVKSGEITNIDTILNSGKRILEPQIVDMLLPNLSEELLLIGQAKGKFGGGQRRTF